MKLKGFLLLPKKKKKNILVPSEDATRRHCL